MAKTKPSNEWIDVTELGESANPVSCPEKGDRGVWQSRDRRTFSVR